MRYYITDDPLPKSVFARDTRIVCMQVSKTSLSVKPAILTLMDLNMK
jgi:hypothetical protein